jgi:hypothetical protein|nr:MAG TPA: Protein of unknown function (DUF2612) [Caudoviricetes sp.]
MGTPTWRDMDEVGDLFSLADVGSLASDAIQSQYAASPHLTGLVAGFQRRLDASADLDLIFDNLVWLPTASGVSLDVWGRIVGIPRGLMTEEGQIVWDDSAYRFLILYKALANISASDAETLNSLLDRLFDGTVYVLDHQNMTIRVVFEFYADAIQTAILQNYGLLARGGGVGWEWYQIDPATTFGFDGSALQPFNQGIFANPPRFF